MLSLNVCIGSNIYMVACADLFLKIRTTHELTVDTSRGETLQVHVDVTFPKMPCSWMSIDVMDVSGDIRLEVDHEIYKQRLDRRGRVKERHGPELTEFGPKSKVTNLNGDDTAQTTECGSCYGAETEEIKCCNSCKEVREAYKKKNWAMRSIANVEQCKAEGYTENLDEQKGEGCHIYGDMEINKVAGNIHFAPGHSFQQGAMHMHDLQPFAGEQPFDFTHKINKLAFGIEYPGMRNPLDGLNVKQKPLPIKKIGDLPAGGTYQYYLKVVPTRYTTMGNSTIMSNQYSVTESYKEPMPGGMQQLPGVFFFYDLSPVQVNFKEERRSFFTFITSACAIVGGLFTISGIVDSTIYAGQMAVRKKSGMGKLA